MSFNVHSFPDVTQLAIPFFVIAILIDMFNDAVRPGLTPKQRLSYLVMPPGWSHHGSRMGSEAIKADYVARNPQTAGMPGLPKQTGVSGKLDPAA